MEKSLKRSSAETEDKPETLDEPDCKKTKKEENFEAKIFNDALEKKSESENRKKDGEKQNSSERSEIVMEVEEVLNSIDETGLHKTTDATKGESKTDVVEIKTQEEGMATLSGPASELDVGITEYMEANLKPFSAIIKQRYSDFIVNEIDLEGNVVHLKTITHNNKEEEEEEEEEEKMNEDASSVLSDTDREAIQKMVKDENKSDTHNIPAPDDKALRTKIHLAVKKSFSQLETVTGEDEQGNKVIKVAWRKGKNRDVIRDEWPKSKKSCRYVRFVLYKENKDTMDAIGLIARNLKVKESMFQFAGTKDRRAKTSQEITAHRVHPKKLVGLNKVLWNMGLGDFRYVQQPLQLGQLSGNHFTIVLRNVEADKEVVDLALTSLKEKGFINYFGMQRFGTTSIPTHTVGSTLLKGDWQKAIDLILAPRNDVPVKDKFQRVWAETKDASATLNVTPRFCGLERNILEALVKKAKPFNALEKLPRNSRLLYIHSYQSLVWNKMVSRRLSDLGHGVLAGDLVMSRTTHCDKDDDTTSKPVVVTDDNIKDYTLTDVVLPLPGHDVIYPANQVGEWYRELMTSDGLDIDNMKRPQKDYSLPGAYRHIVIIPKSVSWSHHRYDDYTQPLTLSDFDIIQGEKLQPEKDEGSLSAVVLEMSLPSSCYATMGLREVMRIDTSSRHQTTLNHS